MVWLVFFFQAEDGIRDLVRSRGLGDVYKRQVAEDLGQFALVQGGDLFGEIGRFFKALLHLVQAAVSYTHLTLPTIYSV